MRQKWNLFYKELPIDKNNFFTANLAEKNEIEGFQFKKWKEYAITGLSIIQHVDSNLVAVTDTDRQEVISNLIQKRINEKKEPDLDLRIYNEDVFENIVSFKKKTSSEVPPIKYTFYNTNTKRSRNLTLRPHGPLGKIWVWVEDTCLEFKYFVEFSTDKKN